MKSTPWELFLRIFKWEKIDDAREKWLIFDETFLVFNIETIANIEIRDRFLISFIRWKSKENLFKNFKHSPWTSTCNF